MKRRAVSLAGREPLASARKMIKDLSTAPEPNQLLPNVFYVDSDACSHRGGISFFLKKDEATDHSREHGNLPVWSIDKTSDGGAKYFVVASYDAFWAEYEVASRPPRGSPGFAPEGAWRDYENTRPSQSLSRKAAERERSDLLKECFQILPFAYEVVLEGKPLHLYLDIEASRVTNLDVDAEAVVFKLIQEFKAFTCNMRMGVPQEVLLNPELVTFDSSTSRKFSKHVIYKLPSTLFGNNYVCGALMRNFHLHLIRRFGPPETNMFYVNPEGNAKSKLKVCILDFAVYTKNRDFRVIGSCKRKGCLSTSTQLRWLWVEGKPRQLTKELFLSGLIQRQKCEEPVKYHIHRIVDTINDGVPSSSSLRTPQPLGPQRNSGSTVGSRAPLKFVVNRVTQADSSTLTLPRAVESRLERLGEKVGGWLARCREAPFSQYFRGKGRVKKVTLRKLRDGNYAWGIETTSSYCSIRRLKTGTGDHKPQGRKANFLIWITGMCKDGIYDANKVGRIKQMCIANSCTGGHGPSKPSWSGWLGSGISRQLKKNINDLIGPLVAQEIERLGLQPTSNAPQCLFSEDE